MKINSLGLVGALQVFSIHLYHRCQVHLTTPSKGTERRYWLPMAVDTKGEDIRTAMRREGSRQDYDCLSCRIMGTCTWHEVIQPRYSFQNQEQRRSLVSEATRIGPDTDSSRHDGMRFSRAGADSACLLADWASRARQGY